MVELPVRKVPGIGRVNERMLESIGITVCFGLYQHSVLSDYGIQNCGDIYTHRVNLALLDKEFGLRFMLQTYLGLASNVVRPTQREETKSIGVERSVVYPLLLKQ